MTVYNEYPCNNNAFSETIKLVLDGIGKYYSCASFAIGKGTDVFVKICAGNSRDYSGEVRLNPDPKPITPNTLYDMASVSKLVSTTMVALKLMEHGKITLYDSVGRYFDIDSPYANADILALMTHTSGIAPHISLENVCSSPYDVVRCILESKPVSPIGKEVHYSCIGYILLAKILEKVGGKPLDVLSRELVFEPLGMNSTCYNPTSDDVAATEYSCIFNKYLCGRVHDENAFYQGGVSGNAGVFSTIDDMIRFSSMLSCRGKIYGKTFIPRRIFDLATHDFTPNNLEDRGLGFSLKGWDISASGELTTPDSYGHNGFTGTSVYCDGKTGVFMILLTNSVHYGRENRGDFFRSRRIFHNLALLEADAFLGID